eukprot:gene5221-3738_t
MSWAMRLCFCPHRFICLPEVSLSLSLFLFDSSFSFSGSCGSAHLFPCSSPTLLASAQLTGQEAFGNEKRGSIRMRQGGQNSTNAYRPVMAQDVRCVSFKWIRYGSAYGVRASTVMHKGIDRPHRPVIGDLSMQPQTGKYYYEIRINSDNCRVGVCTENAFSSEESLETAEFGRIRPVRGTNSAASSMANLHQSYLESIGAAPSSSTDVPVTAAFHGQTSKVVVNGEEVKQLWRSVIPASGALYSFVVDTDEGVVQLFINKLYAGLVFDGKCNLKGKTLFPICSIGGLEASNRSLPKGSFGAIVSPPHKFDCLY